MESDPDVNGFVPNESWGFTPSPQGVDEDNKCEWCCIRTKNKETGKWGEWTDPTIWSKYGENGQDGDGVQYIYLKNNGKIPVNPTPFGYDMHDATDPDIKEVYTNYQNKDDEWLPPVGSYSNYSNEIATTPCVKDNTNIPENSDIGTWTDDPSDVDNEFQYVWVSSRKYRKSPDSDKKMWTKFSDPTLWAKFGESGKNATSIRRLYALTPSTGNPPDLPNDSNFTGDWGTGFPKDYKADENVVWATEAEIWAHNFEFVMSYRRVSLTDTEGNTIPPADANKSNSKEVPYLPDEQITGYTYLIYDKHYYKWDGGWCEPFLVTGVKGDPGNPLDYTTYVFAFGYTDYPPKPPMSNNPANPGTSTGDNNILVQWVDFPNTSLYRDGIQEDTKVDMRWFQCEGHVNNKGEIKVDDNGNLKWGAVTPCNPRDGEGKTGPYYEFRFGITKDNNEPVTVFSDDGKWIREPEYYINNEKYGWFDTDDKMPAIPEGGAMWQIWALIDPDTDTVVEVHGKGWNGPRRVSGEKGEQGLQGPAGLRGVSGLPGVAQHTMYCLGTYGKNTSEYYFDYYQAGGDNLMGDGYFGSNEYQGKFIDDLTTMGWYAHNKMPYSDIIQVVRDDEFETAYKNEKNQGRVICYKKTTMDEKSGSSFKVDTYQYFLVGKGGYPIQLTEPLNEKENEKFEVYIWCIQGNDVYKAGQHKLYIELEGIPEDADENNTTTVSTIPEEELEYKPKYLYSTSTNAYYQWKEIPGDEVVHTLERIEWSNPFKLQGTNGLRGLAGNRGQVVYPMGVYNHEEIYITTDTKAPYVYDPNDGLFYVYNIVGQPWIGKLPENYREVMIDKDGDGKAEYYKYSSDGSGEENTWYTLDQDGDTPANNFANAENQSRTPAWVRFESFQALYTNIGIIANGMIGSAVYNNEFMFSQQGIDSSGRTTNYAVVSGKQDEGGFLSGYKFDDVGKRVFLDDGSSLLLHWYYRDRTDANGEHIYLENRNVNPYERNANGEYIHAFMPNVCINFSTGEMWLSCGKTHFDASGAGYLANQYINWTSGGTVVIGKPGDSTNGIIFSDTGMTIGPLDSYKLTVNGLVEEINESITNTMASAITSANTYTNQQISGVAQTISDLEDTIQGQMDKKADTWAVDYDPSTAWTTTTICNEHIGDIWYAKSSGYTYTFNNKNTNSNTGCSVKAKTTAGDYYWVRSDVSLLAFDYADGSSSIHYSVSPTGYTKSDMWCIPTGQTDLPSECKVKDTVVCKNDPTYYTTNAAGVKVATAYTASDWVKLDRYTDDSFAEEKFDDWAADNKLSPPERKALKDEANAIAAESASTVTQCTTYFGANDSATTTYTNAATYAYNTAMYYATGFTSGATVTISGDTFTGNNNTYYGNIKNYYKIRQETQDKLVNKIYEKSKSYADDKKFLENVFGSVISNNGATLTGYLGVTNGSTGVNNVVACIDGQGLVSNNSDGKLILATGIPSGTAALNTRMSSATTKIYSKGKIITENITAKGGYIGDFTINNGSLIVEDTKNLNYIHLTATGLLTKRLGSNGTIRSAENEVIVGAGYNNAPVRISKNGLCSKAAGLVANIGLFVESDDVAICCYDGTIQGMRPAIKTITSGSYTASTYDHTIIMNSSFSEGEVKRVYLPDSNAGQEYKILVPHRKTGNSSKMSHFRILSTKQFKCIHNGEVKTEKEGNYYYINWEEATVATELIFNGTYWFYFYNSWTK